MRDTNCKLKQWVLFPLKLQLSSGTSQIMGWSISDMWNINYMLVNLIIFLYLVSWQIVVTSKEASNTITSPPIETEDLCKSDNCSVISTTEDMPFVNTTEISNTTFVTNSSLTNITEIQNTTSNATTKKLFFESRENQIIDFCTCDLKANICDINCCCDADCDKGKKEVFTHCDDLVERHYDTRFCNYLQYIYINKTPSLWHINQNSLFCVIGKNEPKSFIVNKPLFSTPEVSNLNLLKQHSWKKYDTMKRNYGPSLKQFVYGNDIWIINQTSIMKFGIPSSFITSNCNIRTTIKYLQDIESSCVRNNGMNMDTFYKDISILGVPNQFNASLYFHHLENCPKNVCIEIQPHTCNSDFTYCEKSIQNNMTRSFDYNACDSRLRKVWYKFYHNGTNGIVKANVFFALEQIVNKTCIQKSLHHIQDFKVSFLWYNDSLYNYSSIRSGNPGYLYGKPLLFGNLITEKENSTQIIKIVRNSSVVFGNFLVLPRNKQGFCILNNNSNEIINFGYNTRLKCKMKIILEIHRNQTALNLCKKIQGEIFTYWSLTVNSTYEKVVSSWGSGNITNIENWKLIHYSKTPEDIIGNINGTWKDPQNKTLYCLNLTNDLSISILHHRFDYELLKNQEKVLNVTYNFSKPYNTIFDVVNKSNYAIFRIDLKTDVMFYDVTGNKQRKYVESPSLKFKLPHDFFYPFIKVDADKAVSICTSSYILIKYVTSLIFVYSYRNYYFCI